MTSRSPRKRVDPLKYKGYYEVAQNFFEGVKLAFEYSYYNAAGVLFVHAAIAYSDAISIKNKGIKISGENHYEVISLLNDLILPSEEKTKALNHLQNIIDQKNRLSYSGEIYHKKDIESLRKHFERFKSWSDILLK